MRSERVMCTRPGAPVRQRCAARTRNRNQARIQFQTQSRTATRNRTLSRVRTLAHIQLYPRVRIRRKDGAPCRMQAAVVGHEKSRGHIDKKGSRCGAP